MTFKSFAEKREIYHMGVTHTHICSLTEGEPYFGKVQGGHGGAVVFGGWTSERTPAG